MAKEISMVGRTNITFKCTFKNKKIKFGKKLKKHVLKETKIQQLWHMNNTWFMKDKNNKSKKNKNSSNNDSNRYSMMKNTTNKTIHKYNRNKSPNLNLNLNNKHKQ